MTTREDELQLHIIELESKLAFQEDAVHNLSDELLDHQRKIEKLQVQVQFLAERLRQLPDSSDILRPEEEPAPPHY